MANTDDNLEAIREIVRQHAQQAENGRRRPRVVEPEEIKDYQRRKTLMESIRGV